ncbi:TPA: hypothetical protein NGU71_004548 [Vibrio parahaemolyticus]|uniref:hypothetical protein n=1 Tax=Vibrio parahaemolyticus TaxID=670 RepID=UPI000447478C|nr:hypothetical protein [Vibrio parahaemolyticus]EHH2514634.1 hypothetical protein [Vibrio parahaemolyticus]EJG1865355.1 hypothetical protein [Vibrio parahaemolyticus]ELA9298023.1 hypothetical protein [Vibrio parahaemolyticus]ELB2255149.1 hypothetical protein [Vibrio parahaemolyticus]EXJ24720.1 hypothetical protein D048_4667 [Vibrio parahaemolyticus VPTS-2009]
MGKTVSGVTTVPGTKHSNGSRTVAYTVKDDNGTRETKTADVSGDRQRVSETIKANEGAESVGFDTNYDD